MSRSAPRTSRTFWADWRRENAWPVRDSSRQKTKSTATAMMALPGATATVIRSVLIINGADVTNAADRKTPIYNEGTLAFLARRGARRVTLPFELPARALAALAEAAATMESPPELEVQVFGRTPLAISARCYHARAQGLHRNNCQYVCEADRDGMALDTLDGRPFLAVNGTQTLSFGIGNLAGELAALRAMGIGRFRLSPQDLDMVAVAEAFRAVLDGRLEPDAALERLAGLATFDPAELTRGQISQDRCR